MLYAITLEQVGTPRLPTLSEGIAFVEEGLLPILRAVEVLQNQASVRVSAPVIGMSKLMLLAETDTPARIAEALADLPLPTTACLQVQALRTCEAEMAFAAKALSATGFTLSPD